MKNILHIPVWKRAALACFGLSVFMTVLLLGGRVAQAAEDMNSATVSEDIATTGATGPAPEDRPVQAMDIVDDPGFQEESQNQEPAQDQSQDQEPAQAQSDDASAQDVDPPGTPTTPTPTSDNTPTWTWTDPNQTGYTWDQITSGASWASRYEFGYTVYNGLMWIMGGENGFTNTYYNDVWYSADGITWTQATASAAWSARSGFSATVFNNLLWVAGGSSSSGRLNDVWYSANGITWTQATASAAWSAREDLGFYSYNNLLWVAGGYTFPGGALNDVWYSANGITWTQATATAAWSARREFGAAVFNNQLWVIGGLDASNYQLSDVWSSTDGITWTQATASFSGGYPSVGTAFSFAGRLWVIGYSSGASVWYSADGAVWNVVTNSAAWGHRSGYGAIGYDDKLWLFGGWTGPSYVNDVWSSEYVLPVDHYVFCWSQTGGDCTFTTNTTDPHYTHTVPLADGTWYAKVEAVDTNGDHSGFSGDGSVLIDTVPPPTPGTPTTPTPTNDPTPTWTWTPSAGTVDHYNVCWSQTAGDCTYTDVAYGPSYTMATSLADDTWYFKVQAVDTAGNVSAFSGNGSVVISQAIPNRPTAPTTPSPTQDTTPT